MTAGFDLDAWLDAYQAPRVAVVVFSRADLLPQHQELDAELAAAVGAAKGPAFDDPEVQRLRSAVQALEDEMRASAMEFTFKGLGSNDWRDLKKAHPPKDAQRAMGHDVDIDRFPAAAIAACAEKPTVDEDQAQRLLRRLPTGEAERLYVATLQANGALPTLPKSVIGNLPANLPTEEKPPGED